MSTALPPIRMTREQLIEALEARRPILKATDADRLRQHKADEAAWLKAYRARLREMLKLPYEQAKHRRDVSWEDNRRYSSPPSCPASLEVRLDELLRHLATMRQERMVLSADGAWRSCFELLTFDPNPAPAAVC
ncbi:MAG: hypothetical protein AB7H43_14505 [Acidimicrobiia bacterium]